MADPFNPLGSIINEKGSWFGFQVQLNAPTKPEGNHSASMPTPVCCINLCELYQNVPVYNDRSEFLNVLEMVFPGSKRPPRAPRDSEAHNLEEFENHCCHLVACLMILRNPRLSTVDPNLRMQPAAPYIVLEFLRQLSCEAAYLFQSIREALEEFWNAKRKRPFFPRQTKSLASHLGLVYEALKLDNPEVENKINRELSFAKIPSVPPLLLQQLECLGATFNARSFRASKITNSDLVGVHLTLCFPEAGVSYETTSERRGSAATFLQVIHSCSDW